MTSRPRAARVAGVALLPVLLAAAAVGASAAAGASGPAVPSPARFYEALSEAAAVFLAALALALIGVTVWVLWAPPPRGRTPQGRPWMLRTIAMLAILTWATGLALRLRARLPRGSLGALAGAARPNGAGQNASLLSDPAGYLAGMSVLSVLAAIAWWRFRRPRGQRRAPSESKLREGVEAALAELDAARDPRAAVVRAYAAMERSFAGKGFARRLPEAPTEYLERLLGPFPGAARPGRGLVALYHHARFSPHEVDEGMRTAALNHLHTIRSEIGGRRS